MSRPNEAPRSPRFHPKTEVPVVPEGCQLVKFHGEPAIIPAPLEGEKRIGMFTHRQLIILGYLEINRRLSQTD